MAKDNQVKAPTKKLNKAYIKRYWQLYALIFLPLLYLLIFKYLPMRYIILAFKEYKLNIPLKQMPWANVKGTTDVFKYFKTAFKNVDFIPFAAVFMRMRITYQQSFCR